VNSSSNEYTPTKKDRMRKPKGKNNATPNVACHVAANEQIKKLVAIEQASLVPEKTTIEQYKVMRIHHHIC